MLQNIKLSLDPYQETGINSLARKAFSGIKRMLFQLATGGGKTVCFAGLTFRFLKKNQQRVLILVHREELLEQARKTLHEWYNIVATPVTAGNTYLPNSMVYVAMVETAFNRLKSNPKYFGNIGLVIVDEAHIGNFKKLYGYFPDPYIIGFTATPISGDKADPLKNYFQDIICGIDIPDLIALNQQDLTRGLVPNITHNYKNVDRKQFRLKGKDFDSEQLGVVFGNGKHVQNTVNAYREFANHSKAIVFNSTIEHSKKVTQAFISAGYPSRHLDGTSTKAYRLDTLKWLKNTPNAVLNNVGVVGVGFDEPTIETVVVNTSTASLINWLQWCGRGARPLFWKKFFTIIDMGENAEAHGDWNIPRNWSEIFFNPEKAKPGTGEAPSKSCVGCRVIIPAGCKTCPHCGATNSKVVVYDRPLISLEKLMQTKPIMINVADIIKDKEGRKKADGTPYNQLSTLHTIKAHLVLHVQRVWRIKKVDERLASLLQSIFLEKIIEWSTIKNREPDKWLLKASKDWLELELIRVFKYEPIKSSPQKKAV